MNRLKHTVEFILHRPFKALVTNPPHEFDQRLCRELDIEPVFIDGNLDKYNAWMPQTNNGPFWMVLCLDVIEYLANPLLMLLELKKFTLRTPVVYVCYQYTPIKWFVSDKHYHAPNRREFSKLCERAGYEIIRHKSISFLSEHPQMIRGIRPFLRCLFGRRHYYELRGI